MTIDDIEEVWVERDLCRLTMKLYIRTKNKTFVSNIINTYSTSTQFWMLDGETHYTVCVDAEDGYFEIEVDGTGTNVRAISFHSNYESNYGGDEYTYRRVINNCIEFHPMKAHSDKEQNKEMSDDTSEIDKFLDEFNVGE